MIEMLQKKLREYGAANALEETNATKEILQEITLYGLWRADFFDVALFHGGTSLRILHGLPRFSEDLDFLLRAADVDFQWQPYLSVLIDIFAQFGLKLEAKPKAKMDRAVQEAVLRNDSIANQLDFSFGSAGRVASIRIKLEIDTNPPAGSGEASTFLDFPADYEVRHQDLPSNFALKIHALLCRPYLKGRDWFDFSWYVANRVAPKLDLLETALDQFGPWQGQGARIDSAWLTSAMSEKIASIDWQTAANDVERFLRPAEAKSLSLWSERFFAAKLAQMAMMP